MLHGAVAFLSRVDRAIGEGLIFGSMNLTEDTSLLGKTWQFCSIFCYPLSSLRKKRQLRKNTKKKNGVLFFFVFPKLRGCVFLGGAEQITNIWQKKKGLQIPFLFQLFPAISGASLNNVPLVFQPWEEPKSRGRDGAALRGDGRFRQQEDPVVSNTCFVVCEDSLRNSFNFFLCFF